MRTIPGVDLVSLLLIYFTSCSSFSVFNFGHVTVDWEDIKSWSSHDSSLFCNKKVFAIFYSIFVCLFEVSSKLCSRKYFFSSYMMRAFPRFRAKLSDSFSNVTFDFNIARFLWLFTREKNDEASCWYLIYLTLVFESAFIRCFGRLPGLPYWSFLRRFCRTFAIIIDNMLQHDLPSHS